MLISWNKTLSAGALVLALLLITRAPDVRAQAPEEAVVVEKVQAALSRGDAVAFLRHASTRVEIAVLGASTLYSKPQATYVLQEFFRQYPPVHFAPNRPSAADGTLFVGGKYWYGTDKRYLEVYLRFRRIQEGYEIREVRVERPAR